MAMQTFHSAFLRGSTSNRPSEMLTSATALTLMSIGAEPGRAISCSSPLAMRACAGAALASLDGAMTVRSTVALSPACVAARKLYEPGLSDCGTLNVAVKPATSNTLRKRH